MPHQLEQPNHSIFTTDCERFKQKLVEQNQTCFYLFGYGSLLWKFEFDYVRKIYGYCDGFRREFWLLSDDHRGTPERMGRVATLVKSPGDRVYGVAYEFNIDQIERLFDYLNYREKCGYSLNEVFFEPIAASLEQLHATNATRLPMLCICYYANEENPYFSPLTELSLLARQIHDSVGPSGSNREYLYALCKALRAIGDEFNLGREVLKYDRHLFDLEAAVKQMETSKATTSTTNY